MKTTKKSSVRTAKPFAARDWIAGTGVRSFSTVGDKSGRGLVATYDDSVVPGENRKLIETSNKIPSSGDVASYEDSKGEDGEGVHRISTAMGGACRDQGRLNCDGGGWA
jgi:hypothetical protein